MKKKIILFIMILIVIVFSYFYAHIDKNNYIYNQNADTSTFYGTGVLEPGEEIRQNFLSKEDTLDGINVKIVATGNVEDVVLHYVVLDSEEQVVSESQVKASELENNKFNKLPISNICEAKDKQYTLVFSSENADEQNGIGFYVDPGTKEEHKLVIGDKDMEGKLVLRTICHRFDVETFLVLLLVILFVTIFMKILYKYFK